MRHLLLIPGFALLAACATRPQPIQPPQQQLPQPAPHSGPAIIGLTNQELVQRLGSPALQIREGNSLKLQYRSRICVLDAYLYPPPGHAAPYRVTYVDARTRAMAPFDQATCLASLQGA